jgi:hypothetical protein
LFCLDALCKCDSHRNRRCYDSSSTLMSCWCCSVKGAALSATDVPGRPIRGEAEGDRLDWERVGDENTPPLCSVRSSSMASRKVRSAPVGEKNDGPLLDVLARPRALFSYVPLTLFPFSPHDCTVKGSAPCPATDDGNKSPQTAQGTSSHRSA